MKRSQALAILVVVMMASAALPVQQSTAATPYSEKLSVFIAGSSAYWYMTFGGVNGSSKLASVESTPGLNWYNVTAIKTSGWSSDFQVFGPSGYALLPVPFVPPEGLFLAVGADSYGDALSAAESLNSYLLSAFISYSNDTGSFVFYSPVSFDQIVPKTLFTLVPAGAGGFANAIKSSGFGSTLSPIVTLEGTKSETGFEHRLIVGSISNKALDTGQKPALLGYFGTTITSLGASTLSSSSQISIRFLDGIVNSSDDALVSNDPTHFTSFYSLSLSPGEKISTINATVVERPAQLLATRLVDRGVLQTGQNVSVTISLTNLSNSTALTGIKLSDDWWDPGLFKLGGGNASIELASLAPGASSTPTYVLQFIGSVTQKLTIPAAAVQYTYPVGVATFTARAFLNPVSLSLGSDDAVVYAYVVPTGGYGKPVGTGQGLKIVVTNVGTLTASSLIVAGQAVSGIPSHGTASVTLSESARGLLGTNLTKAYAVTYSNPQGDTINTSTNFIQVVFSHSAMKIGVATVTIGAQVSLLKSGATNLTLTFLTSNKGSVALTSFLAQGSIPSGLGCGSAKGVGISCTSGQVSINYTSLSGPSSKATSMSFNVSSHLNYFIIPFSFGWVASGNNFTGMSNAIAVPTGVVLSKSFSPTQLFPSMASTVKIGAVNAGPFNLYNASVGSIVDGFDTISASSTPSKTSHVVSAGANLTASYRVTTTSSASGNLTSSPVASAFFFGGTIYTIKSLGPVVSVYQPLSATITTSPSDPAEGKSFGLQISINNPAGVDVSGVQLSLPVPPGLVISQLQGLALANGNLTMSVDSMPARSMVNASAVALASSGITIPFDEAELTFTYGGVTLHGLLPSRGIAVGEDVTLRYLIPTVLVFVALLATALYVRRKAAAIAPASPR